MEEKLSHSVQDVKTIAREGKYNLIPVFKEIVCDLETPVSAFLKIQRGSHSFLFESVDGGENMARYSFIGTEPYTIITESERDPLPAVETELARYRLCPVEGIPSFTGGGVGYVSYDCVRHFEPTVKIPATNNLHIPDSVFMFHRSLVVFDHVSHTVKLVAHVFVGESSVSDETIEDLYTAAVDRINVLSRRLEDPVPMLPPHADTRCDYEDEEEEMVSNQGKEGYKAMVRDLKQNIVEGNIIQAVPSHRVSCKLRNVHPFDIYRELRVINPSPYMFYLDMGGFQTVGASPECLLKCENGRVTTHPIAGTRKRGKTPQRDAELAKELLSSEKERAEHIMLVDLGRNDVGRVATPGTVKVDSLMHIEKYSHVMHIVSHVSGELAKDKTVFDAFRSIFPAGTVSGAPKVSAMKLVARLEKERRGIYAGAVGYVSYAGVLDMAIAIRTLVIKDGVAFLQAGGGIVYDAEEEPEYKETMNKMRATAVAVRKAEARAAGRRKVHEQRDKKRRRTST